MQQLSVNRIRHLQHSRSPLGKAPVCYQTPASASMAGEAGTIKAIFFQKVKFPPNDKCKRCVFLRI